MSSIIKLNLLAMVLLFNGCGHKAPITCSEISKNYIQYDSFYESIILDTAKEYEELAKYMFIHDKVYKFNEDIDTYFLYLELLKIKEIEDPNLNRYCRNINSTVKYTTPINLSEELKMIKDRWTEDFNEKIDNNLKDKIRFNVVDACEEEASTLVKYILTYQITGKDKGSNKIYDQMKDMYRECLDKYKEKK